MTAVSGVVTSAPAVIPTRPARQPFKAIERSGFLDTIQETIMAPTMPAAAARDVVTITSDIGPGSADSTEPPLNPNQPNHSNNTPIVASGMLCPGIGFIPDFVYLPRRGPSNIAPTRAPHPPTL